MLKTIIGNFQRVVQNSGKFPVDADTLENFQNNTALTAALGAALGKNYVILSGCTKSGNNRSEGYVYVKLSAADAGEVLYFPGGNSNEPNCYVRADNTDVVAKGETYENAYTSRILSNGLPPHGEQKLAWNDFVTGSEIFAQKEHGHKISEVTDLQKSLDEKLPAKTYNEEVPKLKEAVTAPAVAFVKGMIIMWGGKITDIPKGWHLCDGSAGTVNLSDRFVVGIGVVYSPGDTGGKSSVSLSVSEMPKHTHSLKSCSSAGKHWHIVYNDSAKHHVDYAKNEWCSDPGSTFKPPSDDDYSAGSPQFGHTDKDGAHTHIIELYETGSGVAHENRPPYYALAYIQYIGV